jgi:hypothetical protein
MAKLKTCKDCGAEVSKSAKTCPNCGKRLKLGGFRIFLGIILGLIIIGVIAGMSGDTNTNNSTSEDSSSSSSTSARVTKENYDKIKKGMTKKEVKKILGEPTSVSESETPGVGTMELNHFQEAFTLKAIDIYYLDGKVYMKNWTDL